LNTLYINRPCVEAYYLLRLGNRQIILNAQNQIVTGTLGTDWNSKRTLQQMQ